MMYVNKFKRKKKNDLQQGRVFSRPFKQELGISINKDKQQIFCLLINTKTGGFFP